MNPLKIKLLNEFAIPPKRGYPTDAGLDLSSVEDIPFVNPGESKIVPTGISVAIPQGYYGRIAPRSGLAARNQIDVLAGVVDPNFRGEIKVILINHSKDTPFTIKKGDRIAQLIITKIETPEVLVVESLDETDRSANGFGSTGVTGSLTVSGKTVVNDGEPHASEPLPIKLQEAINCMKKNGDSSSCSC